jgi:hypothetical protein
VIHRRLHAARRRRDCRQPVGSLRLPHRHAQHALMAAVSWKVGTMAPRTWGGRKTGDHRAPHERLLHQRVTDESRAVLNANYRENFPRMVAVKAQ